MTRSFLLKNESGAAGGYLITKDTGILVRITAAGTDGARLILEDEQGRRSIIHPVCDGQEHSFACEIVPARAALADGSGRAILTDGLGEYASLLCQGGEAVFPKDGKMEHEDTEKESAEPVGEEIKTHAEERLQAEDTALYEEERRMPERRWPPPACMQRARYDAGRWTE